MDRLLVSTLLVMAAVLVAALVTGFFSGPARGIALSSAGLFCLFACRLRQRSEQDIHTTHAPESSLPAPESGA
jgi:Na+/H+ antiporter NhaD/arsenite permease-like protein